MRKILSCVLLAVCCGWLTIPCQAIEKRKMSDDQFLDMVSRACFEFFWKEASPQTGITRDNTKFPQVYSAAATGFGLSAMVVGAERGYRPKAEVRARVNLMLDALARSQKKWGMFFHYLKADGQPSTKGYETVASTIDTGLLLMGMITVGEYFGGEIKQKADRLFAGVNWNKYIDRNRRLIYMAWQPDDKNKIEGTGHYHKATWDYFTDESIICTLLAIAAPKPEHRVPADYFYRWHRNQGEYVSKTLIDQKSGRFVYSWSGALFTYQFAHMWVDFKALGKDDPGKFNMNNVPAIDWFENSRRASIAAWLFSIDHAGVSKTFSAKSWGMTACASKNRYFVGGFTPRGCPDKVSLEGTIAPYGAGSSIVFTPRKSIAALRHYYELRNKSGARLVWDDVSNGGYGFRDSFNLDTGFVAKEYLGIDQGPLLLAIENYRTGLPRKYFMRNKRIRAALARIGFKIQP